MQSKKLYLNHATETTHWIKNILRMERENEKWQGRKKLAKIENNIESTICFYDGESVIISSCFIHHATYQHRHGTHVPWIEKTTNIQPLHAASTLPTIFINIICFIHTAHCTVHIGILFPPFDSIFSLCRSSFFSIFHWLHCNFLFYSFLLLLLLFLVIFFSMVICCSIKEQKKESLCALHSQSATLILAKCNISFCFHYVHTIAMPHSYFLILCHSQNKQKKLFVPLWLCRSIMYALVKDIGHY